MGFDQIEPTKYRYWPHRIMGINQLKDTELWVFDRPIRPKYGFCLDGTDQNMGTNKTEETNRLV